VAAITVYSAPEDGRKGRPKHVEQSLCKPIGLEGSKELRFPYEGTVGT